MAKKRTLTIAPFLNENLKPVKEITGVWGSKEPYFSLYYRVTYNRQGTMIKSRLEESYKNISNVPKRILDEEVGLIRNIVEYETDGLIEDFDLTKLKKKYETYSKEVHICLDEYIRNRIKKILSGINSPRTKVIKIGSYSDDNPISSLVEVCQILIPNFDKLAGGTEFKNDLKAYDAFIRVFNLNRMKYTPTITDWLTNKTQTEMKEKLKLEGIAVKEINSIINNITSILTESL